MDRHARWLLVLPLWTLAGLPVAAEEHDSAGALPIGILASLLRDVPDPMVEAMSGPLTTLMTAQTGTHGRLVKTSDAATLGRELTEDRLKLGIFHGVEFAWARQQYPQLRPLVIAVTSEVRLRAVLVVRGNGGIGGLADLKGQALALPKGARDHCTLFLEKGCAGCGRSPADWLGRITTPTTVEDALDDVVDGTAQAALVDTIGLECFQRRKPGRAAKLKVVQESEVFPAAVVAYDPNHLEPAQAQQLRQAMLSAHKTTMGRQMLTLWKLIGFQMAPDEYDQLLKDIVRAYPAPKAKE